MKRERWELAAPFPPHGLVCSQPDHPGRPRSRQNQSHIQREPGRRVGILDIRGAAGTAAARHILVPRPLYPHAADLGVAFHDQSGRTGFCHSVRGREHLSAVEGYRNRPLFHQDHQGLRTFREGDSRCPDGPAVLFQCHRAAAVQGQGISAGAVLCGAPDPARRRIFRKLRLKGGLLLVELEIPPGQQGPAVLFACHQAGIVDDGQPRLSYPKRSDLRMQTSRRR